MGNAQIGMLKESVVVMEETELKIERGSLRLLVAGVLHLLGERLPARKKERRSEGKNKVRAYSIFFDDRTCCRAGEKGSCCRLGGQIPLNSWNVMRVTLRGEPGAGIPYAFGARPAR